MPALTCQLDAQTCSTRGLSPSPLVGEGWEGGREIRRCLFLKTHTPNPLGLNVGRQPELMSCPPTNREFGQRVIVQRRHRNASWRDRCEALPRKPSANCGGTCVIVSESGGTHFRRQVQIARYIVDFACHAKRVIIEVDGGQHATQSAADAERTSVLEANGYRVLRYWNNDMLKNIEGVLGGHSPSNRRGPPPPTPPHKGEGSRPHLLHVCASTPTEDGLDL